MSESIASELPASPRAEAPAGSSPAGPNRSSAPAIRFAATAVVLGLSLFGLFRVPWVQKNVLIPYAEGQQKLAAWISGLDTLPVIVNFSCTGADVIALCVASILAFPVPWKRRIQGAGIGLLLISVVNTVRIGSLSLVAHEKKLFDNLHLVVWPAILIIVVSLYVFFWMRWAARPQAPSGSASSEKLSAEASSERTLALRFALWLVPLTVLYVAASSWYLNAGWILTATGWTASVAAALMSLVGISSRVEGSTLSTVHGAFVVTPICIATPLVPVYLAAALGLPMKALRRAGWLLAAPFVFFALGVLRLLVLALPPAIVPSYSDAIHSFNQLLFTLVLIALAAFWAGRAQGESAPAIARRALAAIAIGSAVTLVAALTWTRALRLAALSLLELAGHAGHSVADTQSATTLLPAYQFGLLAALAWAAVRRERCTGRRLAALAALLAASQLVVYVLLFELWSHARIEPHVRDQRAWMVLIPLLLAWWLDGRGWRALLGARGAVAAEASEARVTPQVDGV